MLFKLIVIIAIVVTARSKSTVEFYTILNFCIERGDYNIVQAAIREDDVYCASKV